MSDSDASVIAWTDAEEVSRALDNLIENAVAYCPTGARIAVEARNGEGRTVLSVSDNGPGIPDSERTRVFERFFRGHTGRSSAPGTGLGLAIVREIADRWGADVDLESGAEGTRIAIDWPPLPTVNPRLGKP